MGLSSVFTENRTQTGPPLDAATFLDLVEKAWNLCKDSPPTLMVNPDIYRIKLEPWARKNRALRVLGVSWDSPKARKVVARPRPR
jgi:hypothetical protein